MRIKEITIEGFKSIGKITISEPNSFTVFVGPNAAGKSNIFEALEFLSLCNIMNPLEVPKLFGNLRDILNQSLIDNKKYSISFNIDLGQIKPRLVVDNLDKSNNSASFLSNDFGIYFANTYRSLNEQNKFISDPDYLHFSNFSRIFGGKSSLVKRRIQDDTTLTLDGSNLEKVLKRIFKDDEIKNEILEVLQLMIPGFENLEIKSEELSGSDHILVYEESLRKPLSKGLISDGTYNLLTIIAALFQSDRPQFLCIEEPENGLNPKVVKQLVSLLRDKCKEKGHYIWLNTHSQTLVSELSPEEIILVDKVRGLTQIKQIKGMDLHGLKMDEALLTNALGGGIPW